MSSKNSHIINWEKLFSYSDTFQNNKPCKWSFIEDFFQRDFYDQLYQTFPKYDGMWEHVTAHDKDTFRILWGNQKNNDIDDPLDEEDHNFSKHGNMLPPMIKIHFEYCGVIRKIMTNLKMKKTIDLVSLGTNSIIICLQMSLYKI